MNNQGFVYDYKSAKLGDCMLFRRKIITTDGKQKYHSAIIPKLSESQVIDLCKLLQPKDIQFHKSCLAFSEFWAKFDNSILLNDIESHFPNIGHGFGTDLLCDIAMAASETKSLKILANVVNSFEFYEKHGFQELNHPNANMFIEIKNSKFTDFSKFKLNSKLSDITTEILNQ